MNTLTPIPAEGPEKIVQPAPAKTTVDGDAGKGGDQSFPAVLDGMTHSRPEEEPEAVSGQKEQKADTQKESAQDTLSQILQGVLASVLNTDGNPNGNMTCSPSGETAALSLNILHILPENLVGGKTVQPNVPATEIVPESGRKETLPDAGKTEGTSAPNAEARATAADAAVKNLTDAAGLAFAALNENKQPDASQMKKPVNAGTPAEGVPDAAASVKPGTPADAALKTPVVNISAMASRDGKPQGRQEKGEGHGADKKEAANPLKGAGPEPGRSQDMKDLLTARTGEESLLREAEGAATPFKEQSAAKELNRSHARTETETRPAAFAQIERTTNLEGAAKAPQVAAPREIFTVAERTFVIMRKSEESIEVSVEPDGIGKLEIELNMDKGIINARINASDPMGKEIIERNLHDILNTLVREGIAIGGFSVSLRDNPRPREEDLPGDRGTKGDLKETKDYGKVQAASVHDENRVVSIFV